MGPRFLCSVGNAMGKVELSNSLIITQYYYIIIITFTGFGTGGCTQEAEPVQGAYL